MCGDRAGNISPRHPGSARKKQQSKAEGRQFADRSDEPRQPLGAKVLEEEQQPNDSTDERSHLSRLGKTIEGFRPLDSIPRCVTNEAEEESDDQEHQRGAHEQCTVDIPVAPEHEGQEHKEHQKGYLECEGHVLDHEVINLRRSGLACRLVYREQAQTGDQDWPGNHDIPAACTMPVFPFCVPPITLHRSPAFKSRGPWFALT